MSLPKRKVWWESVEFESCPSDNLAFAIPTVWKPTDDVVVTETFLLP